MVKKTAYDYEEAATDFSPTTAVEDNDSLPIGVLLITKVSYDHYPIRKSPKGGSIGDMIDFYLTKTVHEGNSISGVELVFETRDQQEQIRRLYENK